jgi:hypothetical protein
MRRLRPIFYRTNDKINVQTSGRYGIKFRALFYIQCVWFKSDIFLAVYATQDFIFLLNLI